MKTVMKARRTAPLPRIARVAAPESRDGAWHTSDLTKSQKAELGARLLQAEKGEGLLSYDEAMADVDRMVEEMLAITPAASR